MPNSTRHAPEHDVLHVVADPGILLSALISPNGGPAELLRRWWIGEIQLVCSPELVHEFTSVGERPRFRQWFDVTELHAFSRLLADSAQWHADLPLDAPAPSDPKDAYLVALAVHAGADCLVTGDAALRRHRSQARIVTPRELLDVLDAIEQAITRPLKPESSPAHESDDPRT